MPIRTEVSLRLPNSPGALAGVCRILADERVDILALTLDHGTLRIVANNASRTEAALERAHHRISRRDVIVVQPANSPGGLAAILALVAGVGINLEYVYSGVSEQAGPTVVLGVDDAQRAAAAAGI